MFKSLIILTICVSLTLIKANDLLNYRVSPKFLKPLKNAPKDDITLSKLDESIAQISNVYTQALFSGTHTPELEERMHKFEIELFDQLDELYKQERLKDYMKYEAEVTNRLILYNMLKKLFGTLEVDKKKN
ncbi:uncharacterized protein LOC119603541 [Lucilia sericata]|uniref:uncharacterized protein LOC119603541 n=1 Tax=Lucilia sericata TaxID=13632 RepID=UPI0018A83D08|nr:uncharacterized protein LOC119603541 [Lucilia sericata]